MKYFCIFIPLLVMSAHNINMEGGISLHHSTSVIYSIHCREYHLKYSPCTHATITTITLSQVTHFYLS
jgi:hypothetical protein